MTKKPSMLREVITGPKYDIEEFLVPASDAKGHSTPIGTRCTFGTIRKVQELLAVRKFPYKTTSDLLRHALHRHIEWLCELEPELKIDLSYLRIMKDVAATRQMHLEFLSAIRSVEATVDQLVREGMRSEARRTVQEILDALEGHPSAGVWKKKLIKEIKKSFGHLFPKLVE